MTDIITGIVFFIAGGLVAALSYTLSLLMLKKMKTDTGALYAVPLVRQTLNVAALVAAYFIGGYLPLSLTAILVGTALGLTGPGIALSYVLSKKIARGKSSGS